MGSNELNCARPELTFGEAWADLSNALRSVAFAIASELAPLFAKLVELFSGIIETLNRWRGREPDNGRRAYWQAVGVTGRAYWTAKAYRELDEIERRRDAVAKRAEWCAQVNARTR